MQRIFTLKIDDSVNGKRIETVLEKKLRFSRSFISKLKKYENSVTVDDKRVRLSELLHKGQELKVVLPEEKENSIIPENIPLDILYEDEDIIAINKPSGMPTHTSRLHRSGTLINALKYYLGYSGHIITRLDKDTTGVLLVAKNIPAASILTDAVKEGKIEKEYIALIKGKLSPLKGRICAPIKRRTESEVVREVSPDGKVSVSIYETLKIYGDCSLVKLIPITGRTHQLRVHMSHMGTPICGDSLYGESHNGESLKLHCKALWFFHPITGEKIQITSPVAENFKR